jgi:hypothetical protein
VRRVLLGLALVVATGGILVGALGPSLAEGDRLWPIAWILWAPVGYLILVKRPGNGVGAAALLIGLMWGIGFYMLTLSAIVSDDSVAAWLELGDSVFGALPWLLIVWLLLVFPSGSYPGGAERVIGRITIGLGIVVSAAFAVDPAPMEDTGLPSPLAIPPVGEAASLVTGDGGFLVVLALVLVAVVLLVSRWRRSTSVERLQYRGLFMGSFAFLLVIAAGNLGFIPEDGNVALGWLAAGGAIPGAIGIALLRYRLYEIDGLVSRTVTYLVVVAVLAAVFFGVVTAASSLLDTDSDLAIAASTLAVAAMFNPVRKRVQACVDRRFNRSRYDAQLVVDVFAGSFRDRVDTEGVVDGWVGVVAETMQPAAAGVWVRESR